MAFLFGIFKLLLGFCFLKKEEEEEVEGEEEEEEEEEHRGGRAGSQEEKCTQRSRERMNIEPFCGI